MSQLIGALEREKGLIERSPDPDHRRILRAQLTGAGHEALAVCDSVVDEIEETMLGQLADGEPKRFAAWMTGCVRMLGAGLLEP